MKNYPAKPKKRKTQSTFPESFDTSLLTEEDKGQLALFHKRREKYDQLIEGSNIIHYKKTCPGCGFPTFNEEDAYTTCIICLWEGYRRNENSNHQGPPNYISLTEHRVNVGYFLQEFEQSHEIDESIDEVIKSIKAFEQSQTPIDLKDFGRNLKNILPTNPKKQ